MLEGDGYGGLQQQSRLLVPQVNTNHLVLTVNILIYSFRDLPGCPFWHQSFPRSRFREIFGARPEVEQILDRNSLLFSNK